MPDRDIRDMRHPATIGKVLLRPQIKQAARAAYGREPTLSEVYEFARKKGLL